jgi:serine/threonine protein kinase
MEYLPMPWPLSQDYNEAIQTPAQCFADPDLRQGQVVTDALGLPLPCSGNFADVYAVTSPSGKWAVKCFTRQVPGLRERYAAISACLRRAQLPFMVDFQFLEQGILVRGLWYPVLKMEWVEGFPLNTFVQKYLNNPDVLESLCQLWVKLAQRLREAGIAHCDLQHGNVLLVPGSKTGALALKLVDYDGMWVPTLAGSKSGEVGHPSYQHPQRLREETYNRDVDRFPLLLIATALTALKSGGPTLWEKYDDGDNLLFCRADLEAPSKSPLFYELLKADDPAVRLLAEQLIDAIKKPLERTPLLEELLPGRQPSPLSGNGKRARPAVAEVPAATFVPPGREPSPLQPAGEVESRRRERAPLWIALSGAVGLLVILLGILALLGNKGTRDAKKGQGLAQGAGDVDKKNPLLPVEKTPQPEISLQPKTSSPPKDTPVDKTKPKGPGEKTTVPSEPEASSKLYLATVGGFDWRGYAGLGKGTTTADQPRDITVNGVKYPLGLGTHPTNSSRVKFLLRGLKAKWFNASIAVDDSSAHSESPLTFVVLGDGKTLWTSKPVQLPKITQECSISVSGIDVLELRVNCPGSYGGAAAVWLDPYITTGLAKTKLNDYLNSKLYLATVGGFDWKGYNGLGIGTVTAEEPHLKIIVNGVKYPLGLGMHPTNASSQMKFSLRGLKARRFNSLIAVNDTSSGSESPLTFVVLGDGKTLWTSKPVQMPKTTQKCNINVSGVDVLELRVDCPGGYNGAHAVWLDPCITTDLTKSDLKIEP